MKVIVSRQQCLSALIAGLFVFSAGCTSNNPQPAPPNTLQQLKSREAEDPYKFMQPSPNSSANRLAPVQPAEAIGSTPVSQAQLLVNWQTQIKQGSASVSDAEVAFEYSTFLAALDTETDAQVAVTLHNVAVNPIDFEIMLYRLTPTQTAALWSRLPISRVNSILSYMTPGDQNVVSWYLWQLNLIGLAPASSVPWNLV